MVDNIPTGYCYQCPPDMDICPQCGGLCMRPKDRINLDEPAPIRVIPGGDDVAERLEKKARELIEQFGVIRGLDLARTANEIEASISSIPSGLGLPVRWPGDIEQKFLRLLEVNPWLAAVLEQVMDMHLRKAQDYATADNPFVNFEDVAAAVGTDVDTVFRQFIAVKLARLKNLLTAGKTPNNESIDDTKLDLAVYALLYVAYVEKAKSGVGS